MNRLSRSEISEDLQKIPPGELRQRVFEVYHNLSDWLLTRGDSEIEKHYAELGARRATQKVPLSVQLAALTGAKHHLWEFVRREELIGERCDLYQELELLQLVDNFFDRAMFFTAQGYERETARAAAIREAVYARLSR